MNADQATSLSSAPELDPHALYCDAARVRTLVWAARQTLLENADCTIDDRELISRVGTLLDIAQEHAEQVARTIDHPRIQFPCLPGSNRS